MSKWKCPECSAVEGDYHFRRCSKRREGLVKVSAPLWMTKFRYQIDVWKDEDGWYLAEVWAGDNHWVTQGRSEEEIWAMIADSVLTVNDVPLSWWNRIVHKFLIY